MKKTMMAVCALIAGCGEISPSDSSGGGAEGVVQNVFAEGINARGNNAGTEREAIGQDQDVQTNQRRAGQRGADGPDDTRQANNQPQNGRAGPGQMRNQANQNGMRALAPAPFVSQEIFALGQSLSFDKLLSGDRDVSCMTCHHPETGSDDNRALSNGVGGRGLGANRVGGDVIPRNAPALFNLHLMENLFWDGRVSENNNGEIVTPAGAQLTAEMRETLAYGMVAAQAMFPVTARDEMRGHTGNELAAIADDDFTGIWAALMRRLGAVPEYVAMFEAAYPGENFGDMTFAHAANAIAGFELAGFEAVGSPWNEFLSGDDNALSQQALDGLQQFMQSDCDSCHTGAAGSDFEFHNTGLVQLGPGKGHGAQGNDDFGREGVTGNPNHRYEFRTPPLFNIELTAPYGHAGQFADLGEFVAHYNNPRRELFQYDVEDHVADRSLHNTVLNNRNEIADGISNQIGNGPNGGGVNDIVEFLRSMTDPNTRDLSALVPTRVPSGLPVSD